MPDDQVIACSRKDAIALLPDWLTGDFLDPEGGKLHLLAFDGAKRRKSKSHVTRSWTTKIPDGSFFNLGSDVFICSPEFCFLQTAATHSLTETIAYGSEICGRYSFDPREERGMRKREPLTTKRRLSAYLRGADGCPGSKNAQHAMQFIVENCASPMETTDEMLLCLPYRLGGYGIGVPIMNYEIDLNEAAQRIAGKKNCYADMMFVAANIDIEHQGRFDHTDASDYDADRARINAIREMGIDVIELTNGQVKDLRILEKIALRVAGKSGKRIDASKLGGTPQRLDLRKTIFAWNRNAGSRPL